MLDPMNAQETAYFIVGVAVFLAIAFGLLWSLLAMINFFAGLAYLVRTGKAPDSWDSRPRHDPKVQNYGHPVDKHLYTSEKDARNWGEPFWVSLVRKDDDNAKGN